MINVIMMASEAVPFIKTGGLADVAGSLPRAFDKSKVDCRVILPKYACMKQEMKDKMQYVTSFYFNFAGRDIYVGILQAEYEGIKYYFIDNEELFAGAAPYGRDPYYDIQKFTYFCRAALEALPKVGFKPDIVHCNDWQTGLVPVLLKSPQYANNDFYKDAHSIIAIHNLKFQGIYDMSVIKRLSGLDDSFFTWDKLEIFGDASMLKGGIVYADEVVTVSRTYADEIQTAFFGEGLDGLLRARNNHLHGIVNGIDFNEYNPADDEFIKHHFTVSNFRTAKKKNKTELQAELGLEVDQKKFMVGMVSRLTGQKGLDLVACVAEQICSSDLQLVVLGTGEPEYEMLFKNLESRYPGKVSANLCYNAALSHKIYASCDAFLMPSLFEPCGLSQLMSLRYGTLPIVRETGGLKDTVIPFNEYEKTGNGFSFTNYNAHDMLHVIDYARSVFYNNKREWNKIVERAMKSDYSWETSAKKYEELYESML